MTSSGGLGADERVRGDLIEATAFGLAALVAVFGVAHAFTAAPALFTELITEDSWFEYGAAVSFATAALLLLVPTLSPGPRSRRVIVGICCGAALFVAGEEISWGQRILNIETPAAILESNTQRELTIHNLESVQHMLHATYMLVGAYGAFLWLLTLPRIASLRTRITPYVVPRWYLATYFLPVFIFYTHLEIATRETAWFQYRNPDQEPAEFIMSLGFLLFVLSNRYRQILDLSLDKCRLFTVTWRSPD